MFQSGFGSNKPTTGILLFCGLFSQLLVFPTGSLSQSSGLSINMTMMAQEHG